MTTVVVIAFFLAFIFGLCGWAGLIASKLCKNKKTAKFPKIAFIVTALTFRAIVFAKYA